MQHLAMTAVFFVVIAVFTCLQGAPVTNLNTEWQQVFCADKTNGVFEVAKCHRLFVSCYDKLAKVHVCPGLEEVYDPIIMQCMLRNANQRCANVAPQENYTFCQRRPDGLHQLDACNNLFGICHERQLYFGSCTYGEVFDSNSGCIPQHHAVDCRQEQSNSVWRPVDALCANRHDGKYAFDGHCGEQYIECKAHTATIARCNAPLRFDAENGYCAEAACTKFDILSDEDRSDDHNPRYKYLQAYTDLLQNLRFCYKKPNAIYQVNECNPIWIACVDSNLYVHQCDSNYVYNYRENGCVKQSTQPSCTAFADDYMTVGLQQIAREFCSSRIQGLHAINTCDQHFVSCFANEARVNFCDAKLVFDSEWQRCTSKSNVRLCQPLAAPTPAANDNLLCRGIENGLIEKTACSGAYYMCIKQQPIQVVCLRRDHVFDGTYGQCVEKSRSLACEESKQQQLTTPAPQLDQSQSICKGKHGDLLADPYNCKKFYHCSHGVGYHKDCAPGTGFNAFLSVCDHLRNLPNCAA